MGRGGDAQDTAPALPFLRRNSWSFDKLKSLGDVKDDLVTLKNLWFAKKGDGNADHAERLECFYGAQAATYDKFRERFLWGRRPMLAACAARLRERRDLVWVDLGGGTGANVSMMFEVLPLEQFKAVYVVDLCHSLCEEAKRKVAANGWTNVHVVEADACTWAPPVQADLVTFSYSLSMIPPFHEAVDNAVAMLAPRGLVAIADFYVSGKYDTPMRQMPWVRRFFWRATFDIDAIDIGPERRAYLETRLERVWEVNKNGAIPFVPYLRAPYYVWIGQAWQDGGRNIHHEQRVEAPPLFPPTFLYTQSWEDPEPDMKVMNINPDDVVLTLTSGGCNTLNLLLHGAGTVVSVDCNPAQSALLELKAVALQQLDYEDVWQLFGEGRHPRIKQLFAERLGPFLSQKAHNFWSDRLWYFKQGLYYQGGMGKLCWVMQTLFTMVGLGPTMRKLCTAPTLEEQQRVWNSITLVAFAKRGPRSLVWLLKKAVGLVLWNRVVLWWGGGVPSKQYALIVEHDKVAIEDYCVRTCQGVAESSHLRKENYFYYNCLMGRFARDNCPAYLLPESVAKLKGGALDNLVVSTRFFSEELTARQYTKVILMDHVDWLDQGDAEALAAKLAAHVRPGGVVIWRSAGFNPPYAKLIADAGFEVRCLQRASDGFMDRVNMYASFYMATRTGKDKGV